MAPENHAGGQGSGETMGNWAFGLCNRDNLKSGKTAALLALYATISYVE
jgi:hypothetical protein